MPQEPQKESLEQKSKIDKLAHDIRGCLHALRMGRELLKQWYPDEKLMEVYDMMASEEQRASKLLDELLAAARERT
jgi:nitrogen-specific signal transduction histidine kinase